MWSTRLLTHDLGGDRLAEQIRAAVQNFIESAKWGDGRSSLIDWSDLFHRPSVWDKAVNGTVTGPSSSETPYVVPVAPNVTTAAIATVGDELDLKLDPPGQAGEPYRMVGIADGLGAYDNHDGTFTLLMNHEISEDQGAVRAHGEDGAFVSKWTIDKATLEVLGAQDLIERVYTYDPASGEYRLDQASLSRLCSADLPAETAFFNPVTGRGFAEGRFFTNGEEVGDEGRAFAHVASGPLEGTSYELPWLGKMSFENVVAHPDTDDKTVVVGLDDQSPGQVYVYVGDKQYEGSPVDQAGLSGGALYGVRVLDAPADEDRATGFGAERLRFDLVELGEGGDVSAMSGAEIQAQSEALGVTEFLRPEDGQWDTRDPDRFYFDTTDRFDEVKFDADGSDDDTIIDEVGRSRLWRLDFDDARDPTQGGWIEMLLDGSEPHQMLDNLTVTDSGKVLLQEDPGGQSYLAKIWQYDPEADDLTLLAEHDPARFLDPAAPGFLTQDEESSGIIDVTDILGTPGAKEVYLFDVQAHYPLEGELVQGGQLLAMEVDVTGQSAQSPAIDYLMGL